MTSIGCVLDAVKEREKKYRHGFNRAARFAVDRITREGPAGYETVAAVGRSIGDRRSGIQWEDDREDPIAAGFQLADLRGRQHALNIFTARQPAPSHCQTWLKYLDKWAAPGAVDRELDRLEIADWQQQMLRNDHAGACAGTSFDFFENRHARFRGAKDPRQSAPDEAGRPARIDAEPRDSCDSEAEEMHDPPERPAPAVRTESADYIRLSDVSPVPVEWLWGGRIALGKVTLFAGDPGLGKSFLTLDIAARVSTGAPWPDAGDERRTPGGVVLLSAEDDAADTIRPRLDEAQADVHRIVLLRGTKLVKPSGAVEEKWFDFGTDLPRLAEAIAAVKACRLVVIDPISSYMGKVDSHNNAEVRGVLGPLARLASAHHVAVVCITHLRKGEGPALQRAIGSVAFVAQSRSASAVVRDRRDPTGRRRCWVQIKNNLAEDSGNGLAFRIAKVPGAAAAFVQWESDPVTESVDELMAAPKQNGPEAVERGDSAEWLKSALALGPRAANELYDEGVNGHGYAKRTIERARKAIGVVAFQPEIPGPWWWKLPVSGGAESADEYAPATDLVES